MGLLVNSDFPLIYFLEHLPAFVLCVNSELSALHFILTLVGVPHSSEATGSSGASIYDYWTYYFHFKMGNSDRILETHLFRTHFSK